MKPSWLAEVAPALGIRGFPERWVVERISSWLSQNRRMSKDYERLGVTSEAFIYAAMTRIMVVSLDASYISMLSFFKKLAR